MKILKIVNCEQCYWNSGLLSCVLSWRDFTKEHISRCIIPEWCELDDAKPENRKEPEHWYA